MDTVTVCHHDHDVGDDSFDVVATKIQDSYEQALLNGPVFRTSATDLVDVYLNNLPTDDETVRQQYNCSACKDFLSRYGNLATVDDNGDLIPLFWNVSDTGFYQPALDALRNRVSGSKIVSVFVSTKTEWGEHRTGEWTHFAVNPPKTRVFIELDKNAHAFMQHSKQRFQMVMHALADIKIPVMDEGLRVLKSGSVNRSDQFLGPLQWLRDLHDRPKGPRGTNLFWKAVTLAPEGYCHPRSGVIATLLEDIEKGTPFNVLQRKFNAKTDGLAYQRPQTPPSAGNLLQAEALVEKLGIAKSLERRFATLEEVRKSWTPKVAEDIPSKTGIFSHLKAKGTEEAFGLTLPRKTMTWEKFLTSVLPTTERIQVLVPPRGNFTAFVTAQHSDAPPILKWDSDDDRYPVSSYVYSTGSPAWQWGLEPRSFVNVTAIVPVPRAFDNEKLSDVLILENAKDDETEQGIALFPEILKSELHSIRSTIEAYSKAAVLGGIEEASACGIALGNETINIVLRANDGKHWNEYLIDRKE